MRLVGVAVVVLAGCGASPPPPAPGPRAPAPASTIDPITGQPRTPPTPSAQSFHQGPSENLCLPSEEVIFACTLEGPAPQALMSLCLKKGSDRQDPIVFGRERVDGQVDEPFAKAPGSFMISELKMGDIPFSTELEQRSPLGAFGAEKTIDLRKPSAPPRYRRNLTMGKGPGEQTTRRACDATQPITENFEAMRAYKL